LAVTGGGDVAPIALAGAVLVMVGIVGSRLLTFRRRIVADP
jgi:hypothetical protein